VTEFVALGFPDQTRIDKAIRAVEKFQSNHSDSLYASAVVSKSTDGKISVQEIIREGHGGTVVAALIGALAGLPAGPAAATIMAAGGAVIGEAADLISDDHFAECVNKITNSIPLGGAAVIADVAEGDVPLFRTTMESIGGNAIGLPH
jgi:uncharacterized membrane protein